jgi:hypothetical protein
MSLFRLDVHSDTDTLKDLDMNSLRVLYKESMEGNLMNVNDMRRRHFILVDCEVLASGFRMGTWVKYVDADYVADNYIAKSRRVTQRYFGWMKMTTRSLVELWECLILRDLERIAPPAIGGACLVTWDGDEGM